MSTFGHKLNDNSNSCLLENFFVAWEKISPYIGQSVAFSQNKNKMPKCNQCWCPFFVYDPLTCIAYHGKDMDKPGHTQECYLISDPFRCQVCGHPQRSHKNSNGRNGYSSPWKLLRKYWISLVVLLFSMEISENSCIFPNISWKYCDRQFSSRIGAIDCELF